MIILVSLFKILNLLCLVKSLCWLTPIFILSSYSTYEIISKVIDFSLVHRLLLHLYETKVYGEANLGSSLSRRHVLDILSSANAYQSEQRFNSYLLIKLEFSLGIQ